MNPYSIITLSQPLRVPARATTRCCFEEGSFKGSFKEALFCSLRLRYQPDKVETLNAKLLQQAILKS